MSYTTSLRARIGSLLAATIIVAIPGFAAAEESSTLTRQVLPPGTNTCAPLLVDRVHSYVYDGELNSFDVVIGDRSYVSIAATAGDVAIPFNYMNRFIEQNGYLKIHVDTTVTVGAGIPVSVTLLSAQNGKTCLSTISFFITGEGNVVTDSPIDAHTPEVSRESSPTVSRGTVSPTTPVAPGTTTGVGELPSKTTPFASLFAASCKANGAYQLWFILLAIFFVIIALVGLAEPPIAQRSPKMPAVLILSSLAIFLGFWLFAPGCRVSGMIPLILVLAASIGLYASYRTSPLMRPVTTLDATKQPEQAPTPSTPVAASEEQKLLPQKNQDSKQ